MGNLTGLRVLDLGYNRLTGPIPGELGQLVALTGLNLGHNQLTGPIPSELGSLGSLRTLSLNHNRLTGPVPSELGELGKLVGLSLSHNQLASIPGGLLDEGDLPILRVLSLSHNQLAGAIPTGLGNLTSLERLWLDNNQLTGTIPATLGNLANLERLRLNNNQLTGAIPPELGDMRRLELLHLNDNDLTGAIPPEWASEGREGLSYLATLKLASNRLEGPIASGLLDDPDGLTNLEELDLFGNVDSLAKACSELDVPEWVTLTCDAPDLINVSNLIQLDAIRYDLDGDGEPEADADAYSDAFGTAACPEGTACKGYELIRNLDFDADPKPDYFDTENGRQRGWKPLGSGGDRDPFEATFAGNGHTISNLFINRTFGDYRGLFGIVGTGGAVSGVRLENVDVSGKDQVGALAGESGGPITDSYATGRVAGADNVGGLVGKNRGDMNSVAATVDVTGSGNSAGGLVGLNREPVTAAYATGSVAGNGDVGGLVGLNQGPIRDAYGIGRVVGDSNVGGLVGTNRRATSSPNANITASYFNTDTSGQTKAVGNLEDGTLNRVSGHTTAQLTTPTGYTGIYVTWDGDGSDRWRFGGEQDYPVLKALIDDE